jgi:predicted RNase H-like HicB family nuclease
VFAGDAALVVVHVLKGEVFAHRLYAEQELADNRSRLRQRGSRHQDRQKECTKHTSEYPETSGVEMKYLVIYEKTATGYSAYAPDLPGCITTGPTLEETERLMKEAIEFHLEGLREDGLPVPKPTTTADYIIAACVARPLSHRPTL